MLIQQNNNTQDFQGKIFIHKDLNKKQRQLVNTVRPYINKVISDKPYNIYYSSSLDKLEVGVAKKAKRYYCGYEYKIPNSRSRFQNLDADLLINKTKMVMKSYEKKVTSGKYETLGEKIIKFFNKIGEKAYNILTT